MAKFVVLSDAPQFGDGERAFKDTYGRYVWHLLYKADAPIHDIAIEFLWDNQYTVGSYEHHLARIMSEHKPKVIIAMGNQVMKVLDIQGSINKNRGSIYKYHDTWVVPTFSPKDLKSPYRMFAEEPVEKGYYCLADIAKAVKIYKKGWTVPDENFIINPTLQQVQTFHKFVKDNNPLLGADLEGTGLSIENSEITMHGFAWDETHAICIPTMYEQHAEYWTMEEWIEVKAMLDDIYSTGRIMFQNGVGYDVPLLRARGYKMELEAFEMDTMVMHHLIDPESPHNIGFISSMYGKTSFWKNAFVTYRAIENRETYIEVMKYNCRDCVSLHQIRNGMVEHLDELALNPVYSQIPVLLEKEMKAARISIKMFEKGILLDKKNLSQWQKFIRESHDEIRGDLYRLNDLPPQFNMNSPKHKLFWVYGEVPENLNRETLEYELRYYDAEVKNYQYECTECGRKVTQKFYDFEEVPNARKQKCPACKIERDVTRTVKEPTSVKGKSKETKKYLDLRERISILDIKPLFKLHGYEPLKNPKSGQSALDKAAMVRYLINIDQRLDTISNMKRPLAKHQEEKINLHSTRETLTIFQKYGTIDKLKSSFYNYPAWRDGYVRPYAMVTGTATGRWAYKNPNLNYSMLGVR